MRIAFISYEYPQDTADGGIATYTRQAARMLCARGHQVEVFAASRHRSGTTAEDGLLVHRIEAQTKPEFPGRIGPIFAARHAAAPFDVLESPENNADAREAIRLVPQIPLVVRLHTPRYLTNALNAPTHGLTPQVGEDGEAREELRPLPGYDPARDPECRLTRQADEIVAPSQAIGEIVGAAWNLDADRIAHIPNPYAPNEALLRLPVATQTGVVTYLGRLEMRKGVLDLARAIPLIVQRRPDARFRFIGRAKESPQPGMDMRRYLECALQDYRDCVEFVGPVPLDAVPSLLGATDVCVFPSLWENFPCVCLEAMAAARGIVGSAAGGMAEMLEGGATGCLIPPHRPDRIAAEVLRLLENPALRMQMGQAARARVCAEYSAERIAALQEAGYARAIARHGGPPP
ncbi:MAG TPA: glycosyltransferase family 4 protein [Chthonomonadaceae bacterium]|nr:glycosyltransferase family 4 protein [Chthonomonadaceae bacterium]